MSGSVKLNWSVPAEEWERFRRYVEYKHGQIKGYVAREAERAMMEYAEADEYAGVEDKIDRLLKASGELGLGDEKKNNSVEVDRDGETVQVGCRVSERAKDAFRSHVAQTELRLGVAFAHAIQVRRDGGRPDRLEDKLDRIVDEAESLLKVNDDTRDAGESMTKKDRQTVAVCRDVRTKLEDDGNPDPETIPKKYVEESIIDVLCDDSTDDPYDYFVPTYLETVKERLGYVTPPGHPGLLKKEELVGQTPAHERMSYNNLSPEQCVDAVKIELGRQAIRNDGRRQQDFEHFRKHLFDGKPRESTVKNYMKQAGNYGGFSTKKRHGKLKLRCNLDEVADEELLEYIENGEPTTKRGGQQTINDVSDDRGQQAMQAAMTDGGGDD